MTLSPSLLLSLLIGYFAVLMCVGYWTSRRAQTADFFNARKSAPWYLVAFGMIGASLSGVTFISIPGVVSAGGHNMAFSYMQMVLGYLTGYLVIAFVLLPLYYRLRLTSIYSYLQQRFGTYSYRTGAAFFLLSRSIGAAFRLFLVAMVFDHFIFGAWGVPFLVTAALTILLIGLYTFRGGIKTIILTDTLQTACMLLAMGLSLWFILDALDTNLLEVWTPIQEAQLGQWFFFEAGWSDPNNFFKQFLAGMSVTIVMTGLDQDMMQKNLACRNVKEAQKNMLSFSVVLFFVNILALLLGACLFLYATHAEIPLPDQPDQLYPLLALQYLPPIVGVAFILGLIAAAYSSADSALTALTTSFCIDFLGFSTTPETPADERRQQRIRYRVHLAFSALLFALLWLFWRLNDRAIVNQLFTFAGYTYGPLLGLYAFGLFTRRRIRDRAVLLLALLTPTLSFLLHHYSQRLLWGYKFGFEILLVNGFFMFIGLWILSLGQGKQLQKV